jgi:hypothetical protein
MNGFDTPFSVLCPKKAITRFIVGVCGLREKTTTVSYGLFAVLQGGRPWLGAARREWMSRRWFWSRWNLCAVNVADRCTFGVIGGAAFTVWQGRFCWIVN